MINLIKKQTDKPIIFNNLEKACVSVLTRIILASIKPNAWILDPFAGASTTGIAANLLNRRFVGMDLEEEYLKLSRCRKIEIENLKFVKNLLKK